MQFLKRVSKLPVAPLSEDKIEELDNILSDSLVECNADEKSLFSHLCTQLLGQIKNEKAPSFSTIRNLKLL